MQGPETQELGSTAAQHTPVIIETTHFEALGMGLCAHADLDSKGRKRGSLKPLAPAL